MNSSYFTNDYFQNSNKEQGIHADRIARRNFYHGDSDGDWCLIDHAE